MSYLTFDNGEIILRDVLNKSRSLVEFENTSANKSDLIQSALLDEMNNALKKLFDRTQTGTIDTIIFLRIINALIHKPQNYNILYVGQWSPLINVLADVLPKFNAKNFLWCYVPNRPVGKFKQVNFIFAEVQGEYIVPENKFDSIIFSEQVLPPIEILLAAKDYGKIYFIAPKSNLPNFLNTTAQIFDLEQNFSVVELELVPPLKKEFRRHSPQGQLDAKKAQIRQTVFKVHEVAKKFNELPLQDKNAYLDEYITEVMRTEKILSEIFPELHSDTIKLNFNMFKEFLIDFRLYDDWQLKGRAAEELNQQIGILEQDLKSL